MSPALKDMLDAYQPKTPADYQNAVREIVQEIALLGLWRGGFFEHAAFYGGTALRIFHGLRRFSEDLDFTLRDEGQLDERFLRAALAEVVDWVADTSGLAVPADQLGFDLYTKPRGRRSCQGRIGYRGPVSPTSGSGGWPKIKLDLTADERLVLPPVRREVFHPYADRPDEGLWVNCYASNGRDPAISTM